MLPQRVPVPSRSALCARYAPFPQPGPFTKIAGTAQGVQTTQIEQVVMAALTA